MRRPCQTVSQNTERCVSVAEDNAGWIALLGVVPLNGREEVTPVPYPGIELDCSSWTFLLKHLVSAWPTSSVVAQLEAKAMMMR